MFRVIVLMFFVFLIVGCSEENDYSVNRVDSYDLSAPHSIKNRALVPPKLNLENFNKANKGFRQVGWLAQ